MPYKSRFPQIVAGAEARARTVNGTVARKIANDAKQRAPRDTGSMADAIKATPAQGSDWRVDVPTWYAHFPEFGTVKAAARPFLTPAAEAQRNPHRAALRNVYE